MKDKKNTVRNERVSLRTAKNVWMLITNSVYWKILHKNHENII